MTNKERAKELLKKDKRKIKASINYNIMADRRREEYIPYLEAKMGKTKTIWDKKKCIIDTRIRCFEDHIKSGKEFGITVQDDSVVTDDFKKKAKEYIEKIGDKDGIYNFYYATKNPRELIGQKLKEGSYYLTDDDYHEVWSGQKYTLHNEICFAMPVKFMKEMVEYLKDESLTLSGGRRTDAIMQWWIADKGIKVYFPLPSIIDHRTFADSLHFSEDDAWRVCWWFDTDNYPKIRENKLYYEYTEGNKWHIYRGKGWCVKTLKESDYTITGEQHLLQLLEEAKDGEINKHNLKIKCTK